MRPVSAPFPLTRLRRTRASAAIRALCQENDLSVGDLIWPVFICDGEGVEQDVASMPGVKRRSVDRVAEAAKEAGVEILGFARLEVGEGVEKKTEDFAAEVAKTIGG